MRHLNTCDVPGCNNSIVSDDNQTILFLNAGKGETAGLCDLHYQEAINIVLSHVSAEGRNGQDR